MPDIGNGQQISQADQQLIKIIDTFATKVSQDVSEMRHAFDDFRLKDFSRLEQESKVQAAQHVARMESLQNEINNVKDEIKRRSGGAERWVFGILAASGPTLVIIFRLYDMMTHAK